MFMRRAAPLAGALALMALFITAGPASAATKTVKGTVVHHNARAHAFIVASPSGRLTKVYARKSPALGRVVRVATRAGTKGRLRAVRVTSGARRRSAKLRGTVTYVDRRHSRFVVSAGGASILVKARRSKSRLRAATDTVPPVGNAVLVVSSIDTSSGDLQADQVDDLGQDQGEIEVEGIVKSVDTAAHTLVVSSDDEDQSGGTITVQLPATFDLSQFTVGSQVELKLVRQADGTFALRESEIDDENNQSDNGNANNSDSGDSSNSDSGTPGAQAPNGKD